MKDVERRLERLETRQRGLERLVGELRGALTTGEPAEITLRQAAALIGYSVHTLRAWIADPQEYAARGLGELLTRRNGRWRSTPERCRRWLDTNCRPVPGRQNASRVRGTKESSIEAIPFGSERRRDAAALSRKRSAPVAAGAD